MKITEHYKLHKPDQDDFYDVDVLNENMDKIDTVLKETQTAVSNPAEQAPVFTEAETRSSLVSGEKLGTLMGKIAKWLTDLKDSAFATIANNCTTTEEGSVLDARQGQVLQGEVDEINSNLNALKKSVADGKSAIASAITGKGVSTAADASFTTMADNVKKIVTSAGNSITGLYNNTTSFNVPANGSGHGSLTASIDSRNYSALLIYLTNYRGDENTTYASSGISGVSGTWLVNINIKIIFVVSPKDVRNIVANFSQSSSAKQTAYGKMVIWGIR